MTAPATKIHALTGLQPKAVATVMREWGYPPTAQPSQVAAALALKGEPMIWALYEATDGQYSNQDGDNRWQNFLAGIKDAVAYIAGVSAAVNSQINPPQPEPPKSVLPDTVFGINTFLVIGIGVFALLVGLLVIKK